jgi:hypothetical protein
MAAFSVTIPDDEITAVAQALCLAGGYAVTGISSTDEANARLTVISFIQQTVVNVQQSQATSAALAAILPPATPTVT